LAAISGPDPRDPWGVPAPLPDPGPPSRPRVAATAHPRGLATDPAVAAAVHRAAEALADPGDDVAGAEPPPMDEAARPRPQLPAVAVPVGLAAGLPQGVQIVGPRFREDLCLAAGQAIEDRLGTLTPIDPRA